ncbi:helix-turn-helix domain-containing protein [Streptomyces acidiscabies]|uniref:Helix-turn-helix transcriptional regulator n=1 Tax=Streptomyces acidiscabies TaxID=42234 RepID=A0ABU4M9C5_9ACTN|nr:helix-turn-helix transcriptional regulator [Streptomyces acidiscabies]MDX3024060.1 helix-turn-helix transcriptional regulator [Streptomyces acidiscabies]
MAARALQIGETGGYAAAAIAAERQRRGWDQRHLAELVTRAGRPMSASVLGKIESGARRLDVDDLAAVASALGIPPARLLPGTAGDEPADPFETAAAPGAVRAHVLEDLAALGDLEVLAPTAPTLAAIAVRLATEIDAPASLGNSLQGLSKELRQVLAELRSLSPEADDDDLDDLATPD